MHIRAIIADPFALIYVCFGGVSQTKEKQHLLLRTLPVEGVHVLPFCLLHFPSSLPAPLQLHLKPSDHQIVSSASKGEACRDVCSDTLLLITLVGLTDMSQP